MTRSRRIATDGQEFVQILDYATVREAARDWSSFTSDTPFRVPIPEESDVRPVRQLPIETDPPIHRAYRSLIEDRFSRRAAAAIQPDVAERVRQLLDTALDRGQLRVVEELALPVVSFAIAATLGRPQDADRLHSWGLHVFSDPETGERRRNHDMDRYLESCVDQALASPADDLFGELARSTFDDRPLTRDEMLGYGYLVLAGGRDTVIASIAGAIWHLAVDPTAFAALRSHATLDRAVEEFLRYLSPLPHIGRTATRQLDLGDETVAPGGTVSLCFAAANHDPEVFDAPDECRLDRRPNRHVAFGHGPHTCIGAPLARMELATVLDELRKRIGRLELIAPVGWIPAAVESDTTRASFPEGLVVSLA